jgi:hypothetical protein
MNAIIYNTVTSLPQVLIDQIIIPYVQEYYKYKYDFKTHILYHTIHFNKELGVIDLVSNHNNTLINYRDANKMIWWPDHRPVNNVIYFGGNILLEYHDYGIITKYIRDKPLYRYNKRANIYGMYNTSCVHNNILYVHSTYDDKYRIDAHDINEFNGARKHSQEYKSFSSMYSLSISNNYIYICEYTTQQTYNIRIHDINTLELISEKQFENGLKFIKAVTIYKNNLYCYKDETLYIYDLSTLKLINSFCIEFNDMQLTNYSISISNDVMMVSNTKQIIIYDIK